jgi:hypothetical protein
MTVGISGEGEDIYVKDCIIDVLTRIPQLTWLSAGQLDGELIALLPSCI